MGGGMGGGMGGRGTSYGKGGNIHSVRTRQVTNGNVNRSAKIFRPRATAATQQASVYCASRKLDL